MANYKVVDTEKLDAGLGMIADAIREKTGSMERLLFPDGMAEGIADVHEVVKQAEYDRFWNSAQQNGERVDYTCAFAGKAWNDEIYNPKYPITATSTSSYLFWNSEITDTKVDIDIGNTSSSGSSRFSNAAKLVTIRKLIVGESATFSSCFAGCKNLENITIEGVIGQDFGISAATKLTHDSLMSIINALKDYSGTGTTCTLTLGSTNLAKLTDGEKAAATEKGWTLA